MERNTSIPNKRILLIESVLLGISLFSLLFCALHAFGFLYPEDFFDVFRTINPYLLKWKLMVFSGIFLSTTWATLALGWVSRLVNQDSSSRKFPKVILFLLFSVLYFVISKGFLLATLIGGGTDLSLFFYVCVGVIFLEIFIEGILVGKLVRFSRQPN